VRTVQRWEKTEELPIYRHLHHTQGSIYAFTREIDDWRRRRTGGPLGYLAAGDANDCSAPQVRDADRLFIGREHQTRRLWELWKLVQDRSRQVVFVSGEIGIGKTQLVRFFIDQLRDAAWIVEGHCVEQYGAGEAYLPFIEGVAKLTRHPDARSAIKLLSRHAPSWLPYIAKGDPGAAQASGGAPPQMTRELIEALERLSRVRPVVVFLEDLHWSDWSTAELIDRLARRVEPARILVVGTYRTDDLLFRQHPLSRIQHELQIHHRCQDIQLPRFAEDDVVAYLGTRGITAHQQRSARQLLRWTGGNPLFLEVVFNHLAAVGCVTAEDGVRDLEDSAIPTPPSLRDIVDDRVERLTSDERRLLEAASVAGQEFSASLVAAAVAMDVGQVELVFDSLARRRQFVACADGQPTGADLTTSYAFLHCLYASVLYERLPRHSRVTLHSQIAAYLERATASASERIAAALAMHCERAREFERAVIHYEAAAATALGRSAYHEAHRCALKALEHLAATPAGSDRDRRELSVRLKICAALSGMSTMADPRVITAFQEALALSERIHDEAELIPALLGIVRFDLTRGNVAASLETANRAVAIARKAAGPVPLISSLQHAATSYNVSGDFAAAIQHIDEALSVDIGRCSPADLIATSGFGPICAALTVRSGAAWCVGLPDTSIRLAYAALERGEQLAHAQTLAFVKAWVPWQLEYCGVAEAHALAESALTTAALLQLPMVAFFAEGILGWIKARASEVAGIDLIRKALTFQARAGIRVWVPPMQAWLAEGLLISGDAYGAIAAADEGLAMSAATGANWYDAELHGLAAEAYAHAMQRASDADRPRLAEGFDTHIRQSTAIAQAQGALSFELRTAMRRVRAAESGPAAESALAELARVYESFSEGFDTSDLVAARALVASTMRR
jgi:tetratricopeptide (TPR) repeat protein